MSHILLYKLHCSPTTVCGLTPLALALSGVIRGESVSFTIWLAFSAASSAYSRLHFCLEADDTPSTLLLPVLHLD